MQKMQQKVQYFDKSLADVDAGTAECLPEGTPRENRPCIMGVDSGKGVY